MALPDGPLPLDGLPKNAQELRGLRERREILRDQLERATNRRGQLVRTLDAQGDQALPQEARTGVQQRLDLLDARILQLERDQAVTERLIANAPPGVIAQTSFEDNREGQRVSEDDAAGMAVGTFTLGVFLTLAFVGLRRRRARKRARAAGGAPLAATPADDQRIARLTQAVEAIAEEVERIGEGQRFVTNLLASRPDPMVTAPMEADRR
ncbi:hypothetical protein [Gemmatirosa kalamazoonensis]|uniref:hypothetical protein n=1 Tax=Gemmatirosa kalamazoonensis TaxID=861299 RepID=UPI00046D5566|nr:hypothetical protein [Gemmatirosa kalamazoonensis]